jgi:hypothetical protein
LFGSLLVGCFGKDVSELFPADGCSPPSGVGSSWSSLTSGASAGSATAGSTPLARLIFGTPATFLRLVLWQRVHRTIDSR